MARAFFRHLTLSDLRSYARAELKLDGRPVVLFGPNGAGKTNLLEAVSWFAPGRGLRGAAVAEVGRRLAGEAQGRAWSVAGVLARETDDGEPEDIQVGTGVEPGGARRIVRVEGEPSTPGRLTELVRLVWLTPQQARLFVEGGSERRRFLDRLAFADRPEHAAHAAAYEKALRERLRLLTGDQRPDPVWLDAIEAQAGAAGAALAAGRTATVEALSAEIATREDRPFPLARLSLSGDWGGGDAERLSAALRQSRERDAAAGRSLAGPQRTDLVVIHVEKDRPAAECSTGEQKALILNLVLAQAARLSRPQSGVSRAESAPNPILLLDEVAAHLDAARRAALFDEIVALGLQAFLTGTDRALFAGFGSNAEIVSVAEGRLTPLQDKTVEDEI
jgi:DNA replication and repair protein RecF